MARMTGGAAIVKSLRAYGIDTMFGIPGVQLDYFFNALHDERNGIRFIQNRHEQGGGYMAFGYAASSGKVVMALISRRVGGWFTSMMLLRKSAWAKAGQRRSQ